jgi:curli biogenesis system outer membrane secretion channel CsgG
MSCRDYAVLALVLAAHSIASGQASPAVQSRPSAPQPCSDATTTQEHTNTAPVQLNAVKRIFVDSFGEDSISREVQSMIVTALVNTKRFTVTEDQHRADAVLKGVGLEKTSQEVHAFGEGTAVGSAAGGHQSNISGSNGSISGSSSGGFVARSLGINDSSLNTETIDSARIAVRLVNSDGDVIWTTTQESRGAKYKGASADVADMCVKQLLRDIAKVDASAAQSASGATIQTKNGQGTNQ